MRRRFLKFSWPQCESRWLSRYKQFLPVRTPGMFYRVRRIRQFRWKWFRGKWFRWFGRRTVRLWWWSARSVSPKSWSGCTLGFARELARWWWESTAANPFVTATAGRRWKPTATNPVATAIARWWFGKSAATNSITSTITRRWRWTISNSFIPATSRF